MDTPAPHSDAPDMIALNDDARRAVRDEYRSRLAARLEKVKQLEHRESRIVNGRVGAFCLFLAVSFCVFGPWNLHWFVMLIPIAAFAGLVAAHRRLKRAMQLAQRAVTHYQHAIDRMNDNWHGIGPTGKKYLQTSHPYAGDLDIFGDGGLFQLLCATRTRMGEDALASWLLKPADTAVLAHRHEAVKELREQLDLRESLATLDDSLQTSVASRAVSAMGDGGADVCGQGSSRDRSRPGSLCGCCHHCRCHGGGADAASGGRSFGGDISVDDATAIEIAFARRRPSLGAIERPIEGVEDHREAGLQNGLSLQAAGIANGRRPQAISAN